MTYRVFKSNGTKCIRKFENIEDAKAWCWTVDTGCVYRIEWQYENESSPRRLFIDSI